MKTASNVTLFEKNYLAEAKMRNHFAVIDEPVPSGGGDTGPTPVEYLLTAIGGCVAITLRMYAERKGWDVGKITVNVFQIKENNKSYLSEEISFEKEVSEEQRKKLLIIAGKCPVAKMVKGETLIESKII
ncbi:OsmC family protein [Polaribacter litorisediminis]|uniref:OsmC family protein n=1 Tax=Polaribacter litorisediminis TaxID=1908341 RepID=UPI001CBAC156|nr:OsmC family protein [Polaribacter litorisediminis]UAM99662.1 OsmC family protein [Polaribacter litorisediminis]